jgi:hypothetical protein
MQASPDTSIGTPAIDAAFAYPPAGPLHAPAGCDSGDAWRHLTSAVARDPLDVEAHVRRVALATRERSSGHIFTALIDLFLALGPQGRALRALMLASARDGLTPEEAQFFEQALDPGLTRSAGLPMGTQSVLDPGLMGAVEMVTQARRAVAQQSVAEQAAELVNHGDLDGARQMLEDALMQNPDDAAASQELLAIYRYSRDTQAENLMRERLTTRFGRTPAAWA